MSKGKTAKFDLFLGAVDKLSAPFRKMEARFQSFNQKMQKLKTQASVLGRETGISRFIENTKGLGKNFSKSFDHLTSYSKKCAVAFGVVGAGALALVYKVAAAGDEAVKMAQKAGLATETWQEFNHAAGMSGVESEKLQQAFSKLNGITMKAATGGKDASLWFKRAGINIKDTSGKLKSSEALFGEVANKIKELEGSGQKMKAQTLAKAFFGKSGADLMPLLLSDIEEARQEAIDLGLVISDVEAKQAEAFNDNVSRGQKSLWGVALSLGNKLIPVLDSIVVRFNSWFKSNRKLINSKLTEFVEKLKTALPKIEETVFSLAKKFADFGKKFKKIADCLGWENTLAIGLGVLATVIAGPLVASFISLGVAMMTTPVGWVLLGITALIAAGVMLYKKWDSICAFFKSIFVDIKAAFQRSWCEGIVKVLENFTPLGWVKKGLDALCRHFTGFSLFGYGKQWVDSLKNGFTVKWEEFKAFALGKVKWLADMVPDWLRGGVKSLGKSTMAGYGAGRGALFGPPAGAHALAQNAINSTHTEKQEMKLKLELPEGMRATAQGQTPDNFSLQTNVDPGLQMGWS